MAYCRWSTDNFKCEVYAYQDIAGGFTIHLAGTRRLGIDAVPSAKDYPTTDKFFTALDNWSNNNFEPLELPFAGETVHVANARDFLAKMVELRELGYKFPDYVLEDIQAEIDEHGEDFGQDPTI